MRASFEWTLNDTSWFGIQTLAKRHGLDPFDPAVQQQPSKAVHYRLFSTACSAERLSQIGDTLLQQTATRIAFESLTTAHIFFPFPFSPSARRVLIARAQVSCGWGAEHEVAPTRHCRDEEEHRGQCTAAPFGPFGGTALHSSACMEQLHCLARGACDRTTLGLPKFGPVRFLTEISRTGTGTDRVPTEPEPELDQNRENRFWPVQFRSSSGSNQRTENYIFSGSRCRHTSRTTRGRADKTWLAPHQQVR